MASLKRPAEYKEGCCLYRGRYSSRTDPSPVLGALPLKRVEGAGVVLGEPSPAPSRMEFRSIKGSYQEMSEPIITFSYQCSKRFPAGSSACSNASFAAH